MNNTEFLVIALTWSFFGLFWGFFAGHYLGFKAGCLDVFRCWIYDPSDKWRKWTMHKRGVKEKDLQVNPKSDSF